MSNDTSDNLRLFFALWPDDATRTALTQLQAVMHGRRVPYGNLHLTLAFLGQQPASVLLVAKEILARLSTDDVDLLIDKVGYFARNRIAWAGAQRAPAGLVTLQRDLCAALDANAIGYRTQPDFKPHITLARDGTLPADVVFDPIHWHADHVALVHSTTGAGGSVYQIIASRSLSETVRTYDEQAGNQPGPITK